MILRRLAPIVAFALVIAACSENTAPGHFTAATARGVYFVVSQNDTTLPRVVTDTALPAFVQAPGCQWTDVGGYAVLNSNGTYYTALFAYNWTCNGGLDSGAGSMGERGTYEVRDTAIIFIPEFGARWSYHARPSGGTSRGPDLDLFRRNWTSYPSTLHLRREPDIVAAACRIQELKLPSVLSPESWPAVSASCR